MSFTKKKVLSSHLKKHSPGFLQVNPNYVVLRHYCRGALSVLCYIRGINTYTKNNVFSGSLWLSSLLETRDIKQTDRVKEGTEKR